MMRSQIAQGRTIKTLKGVTLGLALVVAVTLPRAHAESSHSITRDVSGFDSVRLMGGFEGEVTVGNKEGITIHGKGDLEKNVITEVKGDELRVHLSGKKMRHSKVKLIIDAKTLESFVVEGAADFTVSGIDSSEFELRLPGAGKVTLQGKCDELDIVVQGAAHINAEDLKCKKGRVRISGTGTISVYTSEEIDARISGLGKISVYGDPSEIDQRISGLGKIKLHK